MWFRRRALPDEVRVPIDPQNWELITDAMSNVVAPIGTAPSAHLQGIDLAGKTGSAQTISNALKAKLGAGGKKFKDNGWFVGVEPRRDPEIVVCTLLEEGEHGYLAARTTAQVIKAYVEKQRRQPTKVAGSSSWQSRNRRRVDRCRRHDEDGTNERTICGRADFLIDVSRKRAPLAVAAPGHCTESTSCRNQIPNPQLIVIGLISG